MAVKNSAFLNARFELSPTGYFSCSGNHLLAALAKQHPLHNQARPLSPHSEMKALQLTAPQQLEPLTVDEPNAPGRDEVLVAVRAIGICGTDYSGYLGKMPFIEYPRILGHELGVEVLVVGEDVADLKAGDRCAVEPYLYCGACHACDQGRTNCCETLQVLGVHCDGGMCERLLLPAKHLHRRNTLSFDQLALVEMLGIGCHAVQRAAVKKGDTVLIIGAGPIGLTVLEFARIAGAVVSLVELSAVRRAFVESHYAGVKVLSGLPLEACAQVVFDATGNAGSMANAFKYAAFTGKVVYVGITKEPVPLDDPLFHRRELTLLASRNAVASDFGLILDLIEEGKINTTAWISHRAEFDALPAAMTEWIKPSSAVVKAVVSVG
jgi:2-desacetyl-2-hydroxyethyl bacteriochlorophyllide A dehydrogenase